MKTALTVKKNKNFKRIMVSLFIITVAVLAVIIYLLPSVADVLTDTWVLRYDSIQVAEDVTCYFIRNESLYKARDSGHIRYYADESSMVRKGTKILEITPGKGGYSADENGTVSYYSDGLEKKLTPDKISDLNKKNIDGMKIEVVELKRESALVGEPLYKMVDTWEWYAVFWIKPENIAKYKKGHTIYLNLDMDKVKGTIHDIMDEGDKFKIVLRFTRYHEDLCKVRKVKTQIITSDYEGLLVRNKSIASKDEQPGVYVKDLSGNYKFVPVSIITSDGEYSLLRSNAFNRINKDGTTDWVTTVKAYDEILNNPKNAK